MSDASATPDYTQVLAGLFDLRGRVAYIAGGYGGIGEAIAWGLALAGARVAVAGRSAHKAEALASALRQAGHDAIGVAMDAHSVADVRKSVDAVAARCGGLEVLVNCIGIQREQRLPEVSEESFDEVVQINLKAAMFLAQTAARHQIDAARAGRDGGRQVHLLSVRAMLGLRERGYSAYCATKGALVMLVKQHAMELAPHSITVNGVAPNGRARRNGAPLARQPGDPGAGAQAHTARPRCRTAGCRWRDAVFLQPGGVVRHRPSAVCRRRADGDAMSARTLHARIREPLSRPAPGAAITSTCARAMPGRCRCIAIGPARTRGA